jgi:thioredoxin reductase
MKHQRQYDVIIVGGSYAGLAAGMALGRALRKVLIIDSGKPCNRQTPYSHNYLTQDGKTPKQITTLGKQQVQMYSTVNFIDSLVTNGEKIVDGFKIQIATGESFTAKKLIFATGIKDIMPDIPGFSECWGISVIHCPYCHGYEVRSQKTGILGNGEYGFEFSSLISNWTKDITLYTNGKSTLTIEQTTKLHQHNIAIVEDEIEKLEHKRGYVQHIVFKNGKDVSITALYARTSFVQHCQVPELLGCELNDDGYIKIEPSQKTTVPGVFACGDNTTRMRTVANAVAIGTASGMMVNKELVEEAF